MGCLVKRSDSGKVVKVLVNNNIQDNTTEEVNQVEKISKLYTEINSIPHLNSEQALSVYKNIYSKKFKKLFGDWETTQDLLPNQHDTKEPKLYFLAGNGQLSSTFKEALLNTNSGVVKVGFVATEDIIDTLDQGTFDTANNDLVLKESNLKLNNKNAFVSIVEINSDSNPSTYNGFINKFIRKGIFSDTTVQVGEDSFFKGEGNLSSLSIYNANLLRAEAVSNLGRESVKLYPDGTFSLVNIDNNLLEVEGVNGTEILDKKEIKSQLMKGKFRSLNRKYTGFLDTAYSLFREDNDLYKESKVVNETDLTEKDLRLSLLNTLNKVGVKVVSISNYIEQYNNRLNIEPSVEALADISKNVIAFAEGRDTIENLTEETSHFIIEGFDNQSQIDEILPLVEDTVEWQEQSGKYYEKYGELYKGEDLDNIVRREVLGKVLKNTIINKFNTENTSSNVSSLINQLSQLFNNFISKIRSYYTPTLKSELNTVLDTLADKVLNQEIHNDLDTNLLKNNKFTLFSLNNKREIVTLQKARQRLEKRLNELKQSKDVTAPKAQQDLNRLNEAINNNEEWHAIKVITSSIEPQLNTLKKQLASYRVLNESKDSKVAYFTPEEQNSYRSLSEDFLPILGELRVIVDKDLNSVEEVNKDNLLTQIDSLINEIVQLKAEKDLQILADNNSIANRIMEQYNLSEGERENLERLISRDLTEVSWFQRNFGSLEHANNPFLGMLGKIVNENNNKANAALFKTLNPFLKKIDEGNWDINKLKEVLEQSEGSSTNYTKSPYAWAKFEQEERSAQVLA